jgi:hypothetical protein
MIVENLPVPFDRRVWHEAGALRRAGYEVSIICPAGRGWEKRVEAMLVLVRARGIMVTDESRRSLESLGADVYLNSTYAERRIMAAANNLILKGIFTVEELAAKLAEIEKRKEQLP